jgi:hypothetical protein
MCSYLHKKFYFFFAKSGCYSLEALLRRGVFLITDREELIRYVGGGGEVALTKQSESHVCHLLDGVIDLAINDGSLPRCRGVEGYPHPDLTHIQTMILKGTSAVVGDWPVVAEADECIPEQSWEPRAVLAHGTKTPILTEGTVGVVIHVHLLNSHEYITNPKVITSESKYRKL